MSIDLTLDDLTDEYQYIDDEENVKAKLWTGDMLEKRVYIRVRDREDGRRFNEFSIRVQPSIEDALTEAGIST